MFLPDGRPVRARLNVTFNEYIEPELEARQVNRQTADFSKLHIVRERETLSSIAAQWHDDPRLWRAIAIANELADRAPSSSGSRCSCPRCRSPTG